MSSAVTLPYHFYWTGLVLKAANQYCAHSFARNWQLAFLNQRKGGNDRRKYFIIILREWMLPTSAGIEPATSDCNMNRTELKWSLFLKILSMCKHRSVIHKLNKSPKDFILSLWVTQHRLHMFKTHKKWYSFLIIPPRSYLCQIWVKLTVYELRVKKIVSGFLLSIYRNIKMLISNCNRPIK